MNYTQFKNKWLGRRIDYDKIYGYQCVDLIKQYLSECYGLKPGAWGNAIDYWYSTHPDITKKFDRLSTSEARRGDIIVLKGVNGNPYGHIGVADRDASSTRVTMLEQNGSTGNGSGVGGDAIRTRAIPRWRVVGILRQKVEKPTFKMPRVGQKVVFSPSVPRTTFKAGTTKKVGTLHPDGSWHLVRGYDPAYPNRILINSASAGGNGVAIALYYTNGKRIEGWRIK